MHGSIYTFKGDPDQLLRSYDAMIAELQDDLIVHLCLRTDDGIILVDTCPSEEAFAGWMAGGFEEMRARHGLPVPESVVDHPVHVAFAPGLRPVR